MIAGWTRGADSAVAPALPLVTTSVRVPQHRRNADLHDAVDPFAEWQALDQRR
jgi:hypothetical protein